MDSNLQPSIEKSASLTTRTPLLLVNYCKQLTMNSNETACTFFHTMSNHLNTDNLNNIRGVALGVNSHLLNVYLAKSQEKVKTALMIATALT